MLKRLGLLLLPAIFLSGGWGQVREPTPRAEQVRRIGLPIADELVQASGLAMIVASVGLQLASFRRLSAAFLALQLVPITYVGHRFWELEPGPQRNLQRVHFFKNVSIIGACLYVAASGSDDRVSSLAAEPETAPRRVTWVAPRA